VEGSPIMSFDPATFGQFSAVQSTAASLRVGGTSDELHPTFIEAFGQAMQHIDQEDSTETIHTRLIQIAMTSVSMHQKQPTALANAGTGSALSIIEDLMMKLLEILGVDKEDYQKHIQNLKALKADFDPDPSKTCQAMASPSLSGSVASQTASALLANFLISLMISFLSFII